MNQSEFAKLHGVSRKTVTQWKARGWLVLDGDDINVEASNANVERYRKSVTRPDKKPQVTNRVTSQVTTLKVTGLMQNHRQKLSNA
ncbi:hypothetical protein LG003_22470 [Photorhabdus kleinii]|uniref:hypothetical protein n=1 Tax=Photorhabdus kleinii TaxID=768034 RepID=UPI0021D4DF8E|nr:hypothetical protein [Photorhabdus kleinii]MCT8345517.1 hypothetical protein [Photorhabdus kleinii]